MMNAQRVLVIGACSGIAQRLIEKLQGHHLALAARNEERLQELSSRFSAVSLAISGDYQSIVQCIFDAKERLGGLDAVICCSGSLLLKPAHLTKREELTEVMDANFYPAFATVAGAAKAMYEIGGSIVLMSSAAARCGLANHEAIASAKAAIIGLTLSSAATYGSKGIRVNCIAPGLVATPLTERITSSEVSRKASVGMHALGRLGEVDDVASMAEYLLVGPSSWITGQVFGVDGGLGSIRSRA